MKKVLDNRGVVKAWAAGTQEEARSHNGNMSFRRCTLFSYSTPIARIMVGKSCPVAFVTSEGYSPSTGRHKSCAYRAAASLPTFIVPALGLCSLGPIGRHREPLGDMHHNNLIHLINAYTNEVMRQGRMRNAPTFYDNTRLRETKDKAEDYAYYFGLTLADHTPIGWDRLMIAAAHEVRRAKQEAHAHKVQKTRRMLDLLTT